MKLILFRLRLLFRKIKPYQILDVFKFLEYLTFFKGKNKHYLKKIVYKSEQYADKGMQHIEHEKLKWKLRKAYIELGDYIYTTNKMKNRRLKVC